MTIFFYVITSEAERSEAKSRDLFLSMQQENRSLRFGSLRSPPVGMTGNLGQTRYPRGPTDPSPVTRGDLPARRFDIASSWKFVS